MEDDEYVAKLCKTEDVVTGEATETRTVELDKESYNGRVEVIFGDGKTENKIDADTSLRIYFNSSTGRVHKITVGGMDADISNGIGRISITSGSYNLTLKLFYNTGKCERE